MGRVGRGRVHRRSGFADHRLDGCRRPGGADVGDELVGERVGLPRCGAVAHGDQLDAVAGDERGQRGLRLRPLLLRWMGVDRTGVDHLACSVDDGDLDAGPEAGIQAQRGTVACRGGEQQVLEVLGEHGDGVLLGAQPQPDAGVHRCRDRQPGAPREADGVREPRCGGAGRPQIHPECPGDHREVHLVLTAVEGQGEDLLLLPAQHCQHPV